MSFDGIFIMKGLSLMNMDEIKSTQLIVDNDIYAITISFLLNDKFEKIEIKCSYRLMPFGIDVLAKNLVSTFRRQRLI